MAESCNGANLEPENTRKPSDESVQCPKPNIGCKASPWEDDFLVFIPQPHVRLERYDITPYLRRQKQLTDKKIPQKKRGKYAVHAQRLSQKCVVKLKRDDLEQLKTALKRSQSPATASSSDSEGDNSSDMAVKCKICDKSYNSEKKLLKHQQNKHIIYKTPNKTPKRVSFSDHVIIHEVKEYHKCRKCPKIFEDYKSLKQHMRQWHKKRKCYICNYCNKKFVDRMFFKVHIRLHCDVCGMLFSKRSKYLEHRRDTCRVYKLYKCKTCEESFFKIMDLKDHSYDHTNDCLVCDICKEKFKTKCAIAHHFSFLHSEKIRPLELYVMRKMGTERLYLCKFCDESSVERDVIEMHIGSLPDLSNKATTGYKDYYFCDQCMKQFDTETDMLQHKWTHFLKTNNNSEVKPKSILTKSKPEKMIYNIKEEIPTFLKPYIVLEKLEELRPTQFIEFVEQKEFEIATTTVNIMKKALVDPKSKKTILSKHQCEVCITDATYALEGLANVLYYILPKQSQLTELFNSSNDA